jgi:hypothetical protein
MLVPPMIAFRPICRSVNVMAIFNFAPRRDAFGIKIRMDYIDHYARQWVKCEECEAADTN